MGILKIEEDLRKLGPDNMVGNTVRGIIRAIKEQPRTKEEENDVEEV